MNPAHISQEHTKFRGLLFLFSCFRDLVSIRDFAFGLVV